MGFMRLCSGFYGGCLLDITGVGFDKRGFLPVRACRSLICSLPHISDILDHVRQKLCMVFFLG